MIDVSKSKFSLGQIFITPEAQSELEKANQSPWQFIIALHSQGQWGDELCEEDRVLNDESLNDGSRLLSAYKLATGVKIWVITEAEDDSGKRAATTVLLPEEY